MFVVTVSFIIAGEHIDDFMQAMKKNASQSVELEEGCLQFDVCLAEQSQEVFLYEVYRTKEDFDDHLASDHFQAFSQQTGAWIREKSVHTFKRIAAFS